MHELTMSDIVMAIKNGRFSNSELDEIAKTLRYARSRLVRLNKASLMLGDTVRFHNTRHGVDMQGTVKKIAIKFVTVSTSQGLWRVPANMLEAV
jgi:hypothetical protein